MSAQPKAIISELNRWYLTRCPDDAARDLEAIAEPTAAEILAPIPPGISAAVLQRMPTDIGADIVAAMPAEAAVAVLNELPLANLGAMLGQLSDEDRERVLNSAGGRLEREWRAMLAYPSESVGRAMDTRYIAFRQNITASHALTRIRRSPKRAGASYFTVGHDGVLQGRVALKSVVVADPDTPIDDISGPSQLIARPEDPIAEVADAMRDKHVFEVPVVDVNGRMIGVVRYDTLLDAVRDEATVDIQTIFGVSKEERALSPAGFVIRKRLPWLEINLLTAFLAAAVVGIFESTIAQYTALAILLPVVAGQSGNSGAQALAVTIRGLALREVSTKAWLRLFKKEIQVGFINGLAIAVTTGIGVFVWSMSFGLAAVILLSMIISMTIAGVAGAMVPIVLARLGQDPAQSSSIVLTTITDIAGFMSFLGIATLLAQYLPEG